MINSLFARHIGNISGNSKLPPSLRRLITVYKGIPVDNKEAFQSGLKGTVRSPQGKAISKDFCEKINSAIAHNWGTTDTTWTSWTRSKHIARLHAGNGGIVLTANVGPEYGTKLMWSPDEYLEQEVLVEGTVSNAVVEICKDPQGYTK